MKPANNSRPPRAKPPAAKPQAAKRPPAAAKRPAASPLAVPEEGERLQKLIAQAGIASRRAAEELIRDGRVLVNGKAVKELGTRADPARDRIVVDGHPLKVRGGPATVILLHKPKGYVTTKADP